MKEAWKTFREWWDVAAIVTIITLILGWALFVFFSLMSPFKLQAQTAPRAIVSWDRIVDTRLVGYKIKRGTAASSYDQTTAVGSNVASWQDSTVEPTTKYYYAVVGIDSAGQEGALGAADGYFRFSDIQPASPANLVATKQTTGGRVTITLSWGQVTKTRSLLALPSDAAITYRVFMSTTQGSGNVSGVVSSPSFQIQGLKRNLTFYFYTTAVWNEIESLGSPAVRVHT